MTLQVQDNPFMAGPIVSPELLDSMPSLELLTLTNTGLSGEFPLALCHGKLEVLFNCSELLCGCNCGCN